MAKNVVSSKQPAKPIAAHLVDPTPMEFNLAWKSLGLKHSRAYDAVFAAMVPCAACGETLSNRRAAEKFGFSGGYVSRLVNEIRGHLP